MFEFISDLPQLQQTLWYVALPCTLVFLLLVISSLFGVGEDIDTTVDADVDIEHSSTIFGTLSFKNLINFLTFFSWSAIVLLTYGITHLVALPVAIVFGVGLTALLNMLFMLLLHFQQDNTTNIADAEGKSGEVYLTIPKNGIGKVEIVLNGARRIYAAKAVGSKKIVTGSRVIVVDVEPNDGVLIVSHDI